MGTGVGLYFCIPSNQGEINIQVQALAPPTSTPLQAEVVALACAAQLAARLNIHCPTFLTDCLSPASDAASQNISHSTSHWNIRKELATFVKCTSNRNPQVFHISRDINGIAHKLAQQVFRYIGGPFLICSAHSHSSSPCPVANTFSGFQLEGIQLHTVYCF